MGKRGIEKGREEGGRGGRKGEGANIGGVSGFAKALRNPLQMTTPSCNF